MNQNGIDLILDLVFAKVICLQLFEDESFGPFLCNKG